MLTDYSLFVGKHAGETASVIGCGTSLHEIDLSFIHKNVVVSVNGSILLMPWADGLVNKRYWISNDSLVMKWSYWDNIQKSICNKIVRDSWQPYFDQIPSFYYFKPDDSPLRENRNGLVSISSVPTALDLVLQMGCSKILLFGVDQYGIGNKFHFWDFWPQHKKPIFSLGRIPTKLKTEYYDKNIETYSALNEYAKKKNAVIYNCNPYSKVDLFEKISIGTARKIIDE